MSILVFTTDSTEWKKQDITGYGVKGRRSHCAVTIGNSVLYFGGYNATTKEHFGDVFIVNTGEGGERGRRLGERGREGGREREREREREEEEKEEEEEPIGTIII